MKPEHLKLLRDRFWRLNNLYFITDKQGKKVRFRMTQEQVDYFQGMHTRNIILKARQLGFTTLVCIVQLDAALFEAAKCALIAHTLNDAKRLFREKVKYAYDHLPKEIKAANPARNDAAGELVFSKGGSLYVSTSFRGGTLRYLHVSEFGKICAKFPHKAREIVTGAFEAVAAECFVTIESTAEGRAGYFFDYSQSAEKQQLAGVPLGLLDWKFFFFSWWRNPLYWLDPTGVVIPDRLTKYFDDLNAKHGIVTNPGQRAWYSAKEKTLGDDMKREYRRSLPKHSSRRSKAPTTPSSSPSSTPPSASARCLTTATCPCTPSGTLAWATRPPSGSSGLWARNSTSSTSTRTAAKPAALHEGAEGSWIHLRRALGTARHRQPRIW